MPRKDKEVIREFLAQHHPGLEIERMPDEENRNSKDIDAIAGNLAIEHTSLDVLRDQRGWVAKYQQIVSPLRARFRDYRERVLVELDYSQVEAARALEKVSRGIGDWLDENLEQLEVGKEQVVVLPELNFGFKVTKRNGPLRGVRFPVPVGPSEEGILDQAVRLLPTKAKKLARYKEDGLRTILLIESNDFQLMNEEKLQEAVEGVDLPDVDEVWFADTMSDTAVRFTRLDQP